MTDMLGAAVDRRTWDKELRAATFVAGLRSTRATLFLLVDYMKATGRLEKWMPQLLEATQLPERTLERHIANAVKKGWLLHVVRGGKGRKSVYQAAVPIASSPLPTVDEALVLSASQYGQHDASCPPVSGGVKKDSASTSEHLALEVSSPREHVTSNFSLRRHDQVSQSSASITLAVPDAFRNPPNFSSETSLRDWSAVVLEAAIKLGEAGYGVLPCRPSGETSKAPLTRHGHHDATTDRDQIAAWWGRWPTALIGMVIPPDFVVFDIDPRNGGSLQQLEDVLGSLPPTFTVFSGRGDGGHHLYFRRPTMELFRGNLPAGVDLKVNGYCIVPPSLHPDTGQPYVWEFHEFADLPRMQCRR